MSKFKSTIESIEEDSYKENIDSRFKQKKVDYCVELLRSILIFLTISRLLAHLALSILFFVNWSIIYQFLLIETQYVNIVGHVPDAIVLLASTIQIHGAVVVAFGAYGLIKLNRYLINFYGVAILMGIVWMGYAFQAILSTPPYNKDLCTMFQEYTHSPKEKFIVDVIQQTKTCCGCGNYKYEDMTYFPKSCCDSKNVSFGWYCSPKNAYPKKCTSTRKLIIDSLIENNIQTSIIYYISPPFCFFSVLEAILAFLLVYRLNVLMCDDTDIIYNF